MIPVRWYIAYPLSYRHIEKLMAERGVDIDHSTINRWVIKYAPLLERAFTKRYQSQVGSSWRMDETTIKVKGVWHYLYRAVDKLGATIDFMLSKKRDNKAAKSFFRKAIGYSGRPQKVTIDKSGSNNAALRSLNKRLKKKDKIESRQIKYLNNIAEQDHRLIKKITRPTLGFKSYSSANATLLGIELHHMLHKGLHTKSNNIPVFEQFYALAAYIRPEITAA